MKIFSLSLASFLFSASLFAATPDNQWILSEASFLEEAGVKAIYTDASTGIALAKVSSLQESILSKKNHLRGHCAGFEVLNKKEVTRADFEAQISQLLARKALDQKEETKELHPITGRPDVSAEIATVDEDNIKQWVVWMSAYPTRYHKGPTPNAHVEALKTKLDAILAAYPALNATTSLIAHDSTPQKSIRLHIPGKTHPDEIVVLGAHLDSVNINFIGMPTANRAPGSDDDASGAASNLETLKHILKMAPFDRSIEFFWYAGEEGGLLGSTEIADSYKKDGKKVVGVLQLDMTLYPGSGAGNIVSMTDYTSPEMRSLLSEFNRLYLNVNILEDKCGYACSDHAPWYKNGYPTLMPSEATMNQINPNMHSANDAINSSSSFEHAAIFSKIGIAFVSHVGSP